MKIINYHFKKSDLQICIKEQKECQMLYFVETVTGTVETMTGIVETVSNDLSLEKTVGLRFPTSEAGHGCGICFGQRNVALWVRSFKSQCVIARFPSPCCYGDHGSTRQENVSLGVTHDNTMRTPSFMTYLDME